MVSLIPASAQYRLSGIYITISGSDTRLKVGNDDVLYVRDSGALVDTAAIVATGNALYQDIVGLSGISVNTGSFLSYYSGLSSGSNNYYISYPNYIFSNIPIVTTTWEMSPYSNIFYMTAISGRTTSGFYLNISDIVGESGHGINVMAKSN